MMVYTGMAQEKEGRTPQLVDISNARDVTTFEYFAKLVVGHDIVACHRTNLVCIVHVFGDWMATSADW